MVSLHTKKETVFRKLLEKDKLGHAYLFFGDEGVGKSTFTAALASYLEGGAFKTREAPLLDARIFAPDEKGKIGIDVVRSLRPFLWSTPIVSKRRTAIIKDAHTLTPEAQSALLKLVEEPPAHGLLIFITHEPSVLLAPILSRLSKVYFSRLSETELKTLLITEFKVPEKKAEIIAKNSFGRLGRALGILKAVRGSEDDLSVYLQEEIIALWNKDKVKYARTLAMLLDRELHLERFTLNPKLQRKAADYIKNAFPIQ
ncbi:MAG: hypothetical protein AAB631_01280 [Patescibacteria group bacterium]